MMKRKALVFLLALLIAMPLLTPGSGGKAHAAAAIDLQHPVLDLIAMTEKHLAEFEAAGDIGHPLAQQLGNRLDQARHHLENGNVDKAAQMIGNFKRHLEIPGMQPFVSAEAKARLAQDADEMGRLLVAPRLNPLKIGENGAADAVIILAPELITGKTVPNWSRWTNYAGTVERADGIAHTGNSSLLLKDMRQGGVYQFISVTPGPIYGKVYYYTEAPSGGQIRIGMNLQDADNQNIGAIRSATVPLAPTAGQWALLTLSGTIPEQIGGKEVKRAQVTMTVENGEGLDVYFDDYTIYQDENETNLLLNPGFEQLSNPVGDTLAEYIRKSTGAEIPVMTGAPEDFPGLKIYVGASLPEDAEVHDALLEPLNQHGFIIDPNEDRITIRGKTVKATEFGVYDFLERYAGVRWLMPTEDGEHVPQLSAVTVPRDLVRDQPLTVSRHFFGMNGAAGTEWANRNRMHHNIQFHHNMNVLFDPQVFADHPEYYADGVVPTHPYSWQPCFNDETAQAAIQRIIEYFDNNPNASSYSLGINDGTNYCEKPGHPDYPTKTNSVGKLHRSDLYYRWVNQIAEGVTAVYPDKYLGLLAYREMYDPPENEDGTPMKLHPNVVPYITDDRLTWLDPPIGAAGTQHTENWQQAAENLGFYEYLYGSQYNVPRYYVHKMADNYRYAAEHGVIGHVAELYPSWGEGAKPWVSAKLQWNPYQDVDALVDEWNTLAVGEAAAPYLKQFYDYWENIWTSRIFTSKWYRDWADAPSRSNYLNFFSVEYMAAMTKEDAEISRGIMEQMLAQAEAHGTEPQKTRARLLMTLFEFYEASILSYPRGATAAPATEQEAIALLDDIKTSLEMGAKRVQMKADYAGHPILDPHRVRGEWSGVQQFEFKALMQYVENEPEGGPVAALVDQFLAELPENIRDLFLQDVPDIGNLSANAVKTDAGKDVILQTLDFSQGPWAEAEPFDQFLVMNSAVLPPVLTKVRLLWDDENLYVGYENFDANPEEMTVSDDAPNGWWRSGGDDSVETYITANPEGAYTGYFTNPKAVKFVYVKVPPAGPTPGVDPNWEANANIESDRWNVIQVIPFSSIGVDPHDTTELFGFFFRNYRGQSVYIGWGGGAPWNSGSFKPVHLID